MANSSPLARIPSVPFMIPRELATVSSVAWPDTWGRSVTQTSACPNSPKASSLGPSPPATPVKSLDCASCSPSPRKRSSPAGTRSARWRGWRERRTVARYRFPARAKRAAMESWNDEVRGLVLSLPRPQGPTGQDMVAQVEGSQWRPQTWETDDPGLRAVGAGQPLSRPYRARNTPGEEPQGVARSSLCPGLSYPGPLGLSESCEP